MMRWMMLVLALLTAAPAHADLFRFYVTFARTTGGESAVAVPLRSGDAAIPVDVAVDPALFALGRQVPIGAIPNAALQPMMAAVAAYMDTHPGDYPTFDSVVALRHATRTGVGTPTTTVPSTPTTTRPSTTVPSTPTTTAPPRPSTTTTLPGPVVVGVCRVPYADVSERVERQNFELIFNRSSPNARFASNQERNCMEDTRTFGLKELLVNVGDLAATGRDKALDCLTLLYTRIGVICPYQGCTHKPQGAVWLHNTPGGRDYQCSGASLTEFRKDLTNQRVRAAAAARLQSATNLRNLLDVDPTLTQRADFPFYEEPKQDTGKRGLAFPIDTRKRFPPCGGGNGCGDLAQVMHTHHCAGLRKTGRPLPASCATADVTVEVSRVRYEAGCGNDENCQWFRRLTPFMGFQDRTTWDDTQLVQIADIEHAVMENWETAQRAGNAPRSEQTDRQHDIVHTLENVGRGWLVVFPWDGVAPDKYRAHQGNRVLTPEQLLPLLVAAYL